ncbi:hypothetical protein GCM10027030_18270 [Luteococcus sediminum]
MPNQLRRSHISTWSIHGRPRGWPNNPLSSTDGPVRTVAGRQRVACVVWWEDLDVTGIPFA